MTDEQIEAALRTVAGESRVIVDLLGRLPAESAASVIEIEHFQAVADPGLGRGPIWKGMEAMARRQLGVTKLGRRESPTRIELASGITVGRLVQACTRLRGHHQPAPPALTPAAIPAANPTTTVTQLDHSLPLRPGVIALLRLPLDLSTAEAEKISQFVRALAMN